MQQSLNPWITRPAPADGADTAAPEAHVPPVAVISAPLRGMVEPDAADRAGPPDRFRLCSAVGHRCSWRIR